MGALTDRYGGRVVVFDHPSVHVDPDANVRHLLELLPPDRPAVVDVVAHSRGGLVARRLDAAQPAAAAGRPAPVVRRLIHVATPNAGTCATPSDATVACRPALGTGVVCIHPACSSRRTV